MFNTNQALADQAAVTFSNGLITRTEAARPLFTGFDGWTAEDSIYLKRNRYIAQEQARVEPIEDAQVKTLATATVIGHEKSAADKLDERYASGMFAGGDAYTFDLVDDPLASCDAGHLHVFAGKDRRVADHSRKRARGGAQPGLAGWQAYLVP